MTLRLVVANGCGECLKLGFAECARVDVRVVVVVRVGAVVIVRGFGGTGGKGVYGGGTGALTLESVTFDGMATSGVYLRERAPVV